VPIFDGGNIASLSELESMAMVGDGLETGQEPVYVESDAGLTSLAYRPELDSRPSPLLAPVTFTWKDLVAPFPE
jgi:hypothetical protein